MSNRGRVYARTVASMARSSTQGQAAAMRNWWLVLAAACAGCGTLRSNAEICPNWEKALPQARKFAVCDSRNHAEPGSKCVAAIKRCRGGCDICRFLGEPDSLKITIADPNEWMPIRRVPIDKDHLNGYDGVRARQQPGVLRRTYKLNWHLCHDEGCLDILASTIIHEAMHECVSVNPPGIIDRSWQAPAGCSAEELENVCAPK